MAILIVLPCAYRAATRADTRRVLHGAGYSTAHYAYAPRRTPIACLLPPVDLFPFHHCYAHRRITLLPHYWFCACLTPPSSVRCRRARSAWLRVRAALPVVRTARCVGWYACHWTTAPHQHYPVCSYPHCNIYIAGGGRDATACFTYLPLYCVLRTLLLHHTRYSGLHSPAADIWFCLIPRSCRRFHHNAHISLVVCRSLFTHAGTTCHNAPCYAATLPGWCIATHWTPHTYPATHPVYHLRQNALAAGSLDTGSHRRRAHRAAALPANTPTHTPYTPSPPADCVGWTL